MFLTLSTSLLSLSLITDFGFLWLDLFESGLKFNDPDQTCDVMKTWLNWLKVLTGTCLCWVWSDLLPLTYTMFETHLNCMCLRFVITSFNNLLWAIYTFEEWGESVLCNLSLWESHPAELEHADSMCSWRVEYGVLLFSWMWADYWCLINCEAWTEERSDRVNALPLGLSSETKCFSLTVCGCSECISRRFWGFIPQLLGFGL